MSNLAEQWKTVDTHPAYEVSNFGRVRNRKTQKFLKLSSSAGGYLRATLVTGGVKRWLIHRLVWTVFNGPIPDKMTIDHLDFDVTNNRLDNFQLLTRSDNIKRSWRAGRFDHCSGFNHANAVLTPEIVTEIKRRFSTGERVREIAKAMVLNESTVNRYCKLESGDMRSGENNHSGVLTKSDVLAIRAEYAEGNISQQAIADKYGIAQPNVSKIILRKKWAHV